MGYLPKWSRPIFIMYYIIIYYINVLKVYLTYKIKDWNGNPIKGSFYTYELQKVLVGRQTTYLFEKLLKGRKGWVYVKWLG